MKFADLKNRHAGKPIWIVGTGASLDRLDLSTITGPRIYQHRAAMVLPALPGETYWLVLDDAWRMNAVGDWFETLEDVRAGRANMMGVFRDPISGRKSKKQPAPRGQNIVHFDGTKDIESSRDRIARTGKLHLRSGSLATAIHLAWFMGGSEILTAGQAGGGFAKIMQSQYGSITQRGGYGYQPGQECAREIAEKLGIKLTHMDIK